MTEFSDNPKITIITPTYYRPDFLRQCILSVQSQEFEEYEHIIVSDHCPYARRVYEEFSEDSRIRFFENQDPHVPNVGSIGKNIGVQNAKTDIIAYCDDDNVLLPNHTRLIWEALKSGECEVVYTQYYHVPIGKGNGMIEKVTNRSLGDYSGYDHVGNTDNLCMAHTVESLNKYGAWKRDSPGARDGEDTELMKRFEEKGAVTSYINTPTCVYYARAACIIDDMEYKAALSNLSEDQYYVFPLVKNDT